MTWDNFFHPPEEAPVELGEELAPLVDSFDTHRELPDIRTHLPELNELVGGLYPGEVTYLAARPGQGKSSFALDLFLANAERFMAYVFSLEMSKQVIMDRLLCNMTDTNLMALRFGQLDERDKNRLKQGTKILRQYRGWIDDSSSLSLRTLRSKLTRAVAKGAKLAIIDYIQMMSDVMKEDSGADAVCRLGHGIRSVAKDLHVPILVVTQLNRSVERREWGDNNESPRPKVSDIYGGGLEQSADGVWLLHRPKPTSTEAVLIVGKARNGATGDVPCVWYPQHTSFRPVGDF